MRWLQSAVIKHEHGSHRSKCTALHSGGRPAAYAAGPIARINEVGVAMNSQGQALRRYVRHTPARRGR